MLLRISAILAAGLLLASPVRASSVVPSKQTHEMCTALGGLAAATMQARQNGAAMSTLMRNAMNGDPEVREIASAIVRDAYATPLYYTVEYKTRSIMEFRATTEQMCYENLGVRI